MTEIQKQNIQARLAEWARNYASQFAPARVGEVETLVEQLVAMLEPEQLLGLRGRLEVMKHFA